MTRHAVWLAIELLMAVFLAGGHGTGEGDLMAWESPSGRLTHWQPYSQGLPTYAMVVTVAVQPTDPGPIYAGTYEPPGLWRSDDGGQSWQVDDRGLGGSPVFTLHWDAVRRQWWAGARDGLYTRSVGAGSPRPYSPWQATGLRERAVYAIAEAGKSQLYAATEDGLFRSSDAASWQRMPMAADQAGTAILTLAVSADSRTLLAGTAGQGLWIGRDRGAAWSPAGEGPHVPDTSQVPGTSAALAQAYVSAALFDPKAGGAAYASTSERAYRSVDSGVTWQAITSLEGGVHAFAVGTDSVLYAGLAGQVARSSDGSRTWELHGAGLRPGDKVLGLAVSPDNPALVYAAAWDGLYVSNDGGESWARRSDGLGYPDVNVLAWDSSGDLLAGTRAGLFRRAPDAAAWEAVSDIQGRPVLTLAGPGDGHNVYAGCSGGLFRSTNGGQTWSEVASELSDDGIAGLAVDPANPDHLHAWVAFGRIHESQDGGQSWIARWAGLGNVRPVSAIHRTDDGQLFAGAEDGLFHWEPARQTWQLLLLPPVAPTVFVVETDARDRGAIYAGATDGFWRSPNGGKTWSRWGTGLAGMTVTALAISPADERIAFAGTRHKGLYLTDDGGATWRPVWDGRLATASVRDILFSDDGTAVYVASDQGIWQGDSG